jgi:Spy/CpxP family protein refolding chaperone
MHTKGKNRTMWTHSQRLLLPIALLALCTLAAAQQHSGHGAYAQGMRHHQPGPYAGLHERDIKALSEQQIADLRAGRGMSLALPAELNGYPGPMHVLELADRLRLTPEQRARTKALFDEMQQEARARGEAVIFAERELDRLFRERRIDREGLASATHQAAMAMGRLRETHLRYHLEMMEVLTPEQIAQYLQLRGY